MALTFNSGLSGKFAESGYETYSSGKDNYQQSMTLSALKKEYNTAYPSGRENYTLDILLKSFGGEKFVCGANSGKSNANEVLRRSGQVFSEMNNFTTVEHDRTN